MTKYQGKNIKVSRYVSWRVGIAFGPTQTRKYIIQTLRRIELNLDQPWANLYIYWFGLNLKFYHAPYAANTYLHNIENFQENQHIKLTILKYRIHDNIWKIPNLRLIYILIINKMNNSPTITLKYPSTNWDLIWNNYAKIQKFA